MDLGACLKEIWVRFVDPGACSVDLLARSSGCLEFNGVGVVVSGPYFI